jgi:hypothetical protein
VSAQDTIPVPQGYNFKNADSFIKSKIRLKIRPEIRLYYGLSSPIQYSPSQANGKFQLEANSNPVYGMGLGINLQSDKNTFGFEAALFQQAISIDHKFFGVTKYDPIGDQTPSFNFYKFIFRYARTIQLNNKFELVPELNAGFRYFEPTFFSQSIRFNQSQSSDIFNERFFNNIRNEQIWFDVGFGINVQRRIFKNKRLSLGLTTSFINRPFAIGDYYYNFNNETHTGSTKNYLNYLAIQTAFTF